MKKLIIFLLALLPFVTSAQDRVFELFGYNKFKLGDMTLSYTSADGLLVNGAKATAAQVNAVAQALSGNNSPITSGGVYAALLAQNKKLQFSLDSLSRLKADSALKVSRKTIDSLNTPFDANRFITVTDNKAGIDTAKLHAQVKAWLAGTTYTPATVDNSAASAGYTVLDYFKIADKTVKTSDFGSSFDQVKGTVFNIVKNAGGLSINGQYLTVSTANDPTLLYLNGNFLDGKHYKVTFYNSTVNTSNEFYNGNASKGTQSGSNVVYEIDSPGNKEKIDFYLNGINLVFAEVKVEVKN